jgi:DNA polymerase III subunit epsilon
MRWPRTAGAAARHLRADWREAEYCAIDVETTGLDLDQDSVVSVGSVPIRDGRVIYREHYYSLIRPVGPVSVAAMRVHYLRPADLAQAPPAGEVARQVADQLAGRIVVAHAAWIERAFLSRLLRQAGARFGARMIDTAALARALGYAAGARDGHEPSLELLARQLSLPVYAPHHALGDAVTTAAVFLAMATRAARPASQASRGTVSARSLIALSARHAY